MAKSLSNEMKAIFEKYPVLDGNGVMPYDRSAEKCETITEKNVDQAIDLLRFKDSFMVVYENEIGHKEDIRATAVWPMEYLGRLKAKAENKLSGIIGMIIPDGKPSKQSEAANDTV